MSSCVCKISFKSAQVCGGCCKMFRGLTFLGHSVDRLVGILRSPARRSNDHFFVLSFLCHLLVNERLPVCTMQAVTTSVRCRSVGSAFSAGSMPNVREVASHTHTSINRCRRFAKLAHLQACGAACRRLKPNGTETPALSHL